MIRLLDSIAPLVSSTFGPCSLSAADMVGSLNVDDSLDTACSLGMAGSLYAADSLDTAVGSLDAAAGSLDTAAGSLDTEG